jgi:transposase InsO family protein
MNKITQTMLYRQSLIKYAEKFGVTKAAIKYKTNRQYIYRWKRRYNGNIQSLADKSHRPNGHKNQHTTQELKLIADMRRRNPNSGLVVFWVKLMQRGYSRSITGLYRVLRKQGQMAVKPPNPKYIPKPYELMYYPGQRVQIDVKHVPAACIVGDAKGKKFYQYTAIDEFSRYRYLEAFEEASTFSSAQFLEHLLKAFPFKVECIQTDNGFEFTKKFGGYKNSPTMFERYLQNHGIRHKLIRPYTPRHNGKVERSHRKDNEYFYATHKFFSFSDFKSQLAVHSRYYNNFPMRPLNWKSPKRTLYDFLRFGVTYH